MIRLFPFIILAFTRQTVAQCMNTGGFEAVEWSTHTHGDWIQSTSEGNWEAVSSYVNSGAATANSGSNYFGMNLAGDELVSPAYTDPCNLSFYIRTSSDPDDWVLEVQTSTNLAGPWTAQSTIIENGVGGAITDVYSLQNLTINLSGTYYIRFYVSSRSAGSVYLDDISLTCSCLINTITTTVLSGTPFTVDCFGTEDTGTIDFTSVGTFNVGNTFTAQLSNSSGSFSNPVNLGTLASNGVNPFGTININIPAGTNGGTGYLTRIISNNPSTVGSSSSIFTIVQNGTCGPTLPASEGLIINEWSNGPSGNEEYYEFVVAGSCGTSVDIRGYILDDNNATFTNPADYDATASGIAPGHFRFADNPQWAAIPVGSLIVIYNASEPNPNLPADDPNDFDNDSLYVIPHTHSLFESCSIYPMITSPDSVYTPCVYTTGGGWNPLSLRNTGDAIQVRSPNGVYYHGVSYGGSEMTGGPHNLKLFNSSGAQMCGWFSDNDFFNVNNWTYGNVAGNETPGLPNNSANYNWLLAMRSIIGTSCPITILPIELSLFTGLKTSFGNKLTWRTETETNSDYFILERTINGYDWETITKVKSVGNSSSPTNYVFLDDRYEDVINYYRLIQIDIDGSEINHKKNVAIDNSSSENIQLVRIINLLGQEINCDQKGMQILIYSDGTIQKKYKN